MIIADLLLLGVYPCCALSTILLDRSADAKLDALADFEYNSVVGHLEIELGSWCTRFLVLRIEEVTQGADRQRPVFLECLVVQKHGNVCFKICQIHDTVLGSIISSPS